MKTRKDADYSFQHTKDRMMERFGLELTKKEYDNYSWLCEIGRIPFFHSEPNGYDIQYLHKTFHRGIEVIFLFSQEKQRITTVIRGRTK
jgi:hypothetical protein